MTTCRSWLTRSTPQPRSWRMRSISAYSSSWPLKSTPCTGSSRISSPGSRTSARASTTRCSSPPDSSCIEACARWPAPTAASTGAVVAPAPGADGQEPAHGQRQDRIHPDPLRHVADDQPRLTPDPPRGRLEQAQEHADQRGLAGAVRPDQRDHLARPDAEVDGAEQLAAPDPDRDRLRLDQQRRRGLGHQLEQLGMAGWQPRHTPWTSTICWPTAKPRSAACIAIALWIAGASNSLT